MPSQKNPQRTRAQEAETTAAKRRAKKAGLPYLDLDTQKISPEHAAKILPIRIMRDFEVVPFRRCLKPRNGKPYVDLLTTGRKLSPEEVDQIFFFSGTHTIKLYVGEPSKIQAFIEKAHKTLGEPSCGVTIVGLPISNNFDIDDSD